MKEEKIKNLYNKTLKEILNTYYILYNEECGYPYGIITQKLAEETYQTYNIEKDYPEAITTQPLIPIELTLNDEDPLINKTKIIKLMKTLNISKKEKNTQKK